MSLFQKSVINKYLKTLDSVEVEKSFLKFKEFYGNSARLENIRLLKEENYQEGFLREIFVQVLGYTINPDENYNLTTEFKNLTDAKKADGAILDDGKAIGVIELKSTKTTSLESITEQAFNYKNHQPNCRYIINSNFEKIRFYIDNATDFEEFNLFTLSEDDFKILYLILSKESIFNEVPLKLKKESVLHEENISKQLYQDYSQFKRKIFENLVKNNPQFDKLTLFKKSQKLLDRFLFILFGEDSGLVPPNAVSKIIDQWKAFTELDEPVTLYSRFIKLFHHLDVGHKYKTFEIPAYNGGLFREDKILDDFQIDDEILLNDSLKLSSYDFQTEIDVNILGHIFENSLNEIEELTAELEGKAVDKKKTKRKKEGVYYTPKYITKYIVKNTVGKLCNQKKKELNLDEIDISIIQNSRTKQGKLNQKAVDLLKRLKSYSDYLLSLKILDPACGSGAFLNQALEFLIEEHQFVDEYRRQLEKDSLGLFDIKKSILENNIYGVDINEESVEIAKLSLWLRTAERGRKLSDLSSNIKCGNSLIDDPEVAGEKAFKWKEEFPEITANGGFDVVIGNPPYVSNWTLSEVNRELVVYLERQYSKYLSGHWDLFNCFIILSVSILKNDGYHSFILPSSFFKEKYAKKIRQLFIKELELTNLIDFGEQVVFDDVARQTGIYVIRKKHPLDKMTEISFSIEGQKNSVNQKFFAELKNYAFKTNVSKVDVSLFEKLHSNTLLLGNLVCINTGVVAHSKKDSPIKFIKDDVLHKQCMDNYKPYVIGSNISRYHIRFNSDYLDYESKKEYFHRPKFRLLFESEKIIVRRISGSNNSIISCYDDKIFYSNDNLMHLVLWSEKILEFQKAERKWTPVLNSEISLKYIQMFINSKLLSYYFNKFLSTDTLQGSYSSIYPEDLRQFPIVQITLEKQNDYTSNVDKMLSLNNDFHLKVKIFLDRIKSNFEFIKSSRKIEYFYEYDFKTFVDELKKQKIFLSLIQQDEWEEYFNERKSEINSIQNQILETDKEIDQIIYELFDLTESEIKIVENNLK